jgi:serine/threonine-protein kinase RsbW
MTANGDQGERRDELVLLMSPQADFVATARLFAASVARHVGCKEETVEDLKVAISEAVTNSIKAQRTAGVSESIRVVARVGRSLSFEVVDAGRGFGVSPPLQQETTPSGGLYEGSFGLALIRALFGDVSIEPNQNGGTTVRFSLPLPERAPAPADL